MILLGIESSCDETAFALVEDGARVLTNAIASQIELHARFGGVVPEIASRAHLECSVPLFRTVFDSTGLSITDVDAIAVTRGPGLAGCLLIGVEFAKALALRHRKPLVPVHHIAGHLYSPHIGRESDAWGAAVSEPGTDFEPYLCLVVSGGHSSLVLVRPPLEFEVLGETLDDAAGEAYDKVAKLLGLGYPGGPLLDGLAAEGNPTAFALPRPLMDREDFNFSFSGLKAAVARVVETQEKGGRNPLSPRFVADMAASFQAAAVDVLLGKAARALERTGLPRLAIAGGVACNSALRLEARARLDGIEIAIPAPEFCTDNAAMIAGIGYHAFAAGGAAGLGLNVAPSLALAPSSRWTERL